MPNKLKLCVVGIDYSMTSPAITIHTGNKWSIDNCKIHYLTPTQKYLQKPFQFLNPREYPDFTLYCNAYRFNWLANWTCDIIRDAGRNYNFIDIFIEDYAYAAKGQVFHIGENTGKLKDVLWSSLMEYKVVAPAQLKKFATGKGNASKGMMYESFLKDTNCDFTKEIEKVNPEKSPISDIVDSYFIAKYGFTQVTEET